MIEFESRKLEVKFDGTMYSMKYPTVEEMISYDEDFDKTENKVQLMVNFFEKLGLEKDIVQKLEMWQLNKLMEELNKPKK